MSTESEPSTIVRLEYERRGTLHVSGRVVAVENGDEFDVNPFDGLTFAQMIVRLSEASSYWSAARVVLRRTDRPGLKDFTLDPESTELLQTDPIMLIRSMTFESPKVDMTKVRAKEAPSFVVAGYGLLAASFGDEVLVRRRADRCECPGCGRWVSVEDTHSKCTSRVCGASFLVKERGSHWFAVRVDALLGSCFDRFFLPREWNKSGTWASADDLRELHTKWLDRKVRL